MSRLYFVVPAAMSLLALLHLPYGYYQLLRLVVTVCAGLLAWNASQKQMYPAVAVFGILAFTYNPVFPIRLDREVWAWINAATAVVFLGALPVYERLEWKQRAADAPDQKQLNE